MDSEQEEEEEVREREQQTEAQEEVLQVLKQLGKANARMVADALGVNSGNTWKRLNTLWKRGQLEKETIGKAIYYFLPEQSGKKEQSNEQLEFLKSPQ